MEEPKLKAWIVWAHDPCQEGGWHIHGSYNTKEEAVAQAKALHAREVKSYRESVEESKKEEQPYPREYRWGMFCYDSCMVTGGDVFSLEGEVEA